MKKREVDVLAKAASGLNLSALASEEASDYQLHPSAKGNIKFRQLKRVLISWLNRYLSQVGTVVQDLPEDLSDGQALAQFLMQMTDEKIQTSPAVSDKAKKANLQAVVSFVEKRLNIESKGRWSAEGLFRKDIGSSYNIVIDLAHNLRCPEPLPSNVQIAVIYTEDINGVKKNKTTMIQLTEDETPYQTPEMLQHRMLSSMGSLNDMNAISKSNMNLYGSQALGSQASIETDAFDILLNGEHDEELQKVIELLTTFVNKHLEEAGVTVDNIQADMSDGVYFIIVTGALGKFFVPLNKFTVKPTTVDEKLLNVKFAFKLMESAGVTANRWNAMEVVRCDLRAILRVTFDLFKAFNVFQ